MEAANDEIIRLAVQKYNVKESDVEIRRDLFSSNNPDVIPGTFNVKIVMGSVALMQQAVRQWNADQGFHFVLRDHAPAAMSAATDKPWDEGRKIQENARIKEGNTGLDSVVMELKSDVKNELQPANYRVKIQIGPSASNKISLQVDTGSSILWAQSRVQTREKPPVGRPFLDVTIADAAKFQGVDLYNVQYGTGKKIEIGLFEAAVTISSLKTNQVFGVVEIQPEGSTLPLGIIGLGFAQKNSAIPYHRTLVAQLKQSGAIKRASFALIGPRAEPAGTFKPNGQEVRDRGWLVIGSLGEELHNGITWCPAFVDEHRSWVVRLNKVTVNGTIVAENQLALIDTGSSYLTVGKTNATHVASIVGGTAKGGDVLCPVGALKEFSFTFGESGDEATFQLNEEDLSLGLAPGPNSNQTRSPLTYLDRFDNSGKRDFWVLGGIFIDNMITVFDYTGDERIGFASRSEIDPVITEVVGI